MSHVCTLVVGAFRIFGVKREKLCKNKRPKGPLSLTWVQSALQKFDFGMEPKTATLHPTCFKITAMHSVCCYNLLGWRSFWNVPPSLMDWPGWQILFTFRPEKHKLGRGRWELAFCQVSLNSVQQFQRKSRKCLSQSEDRTAILFFWSAQKTQAW